MSRKGCLLGLAVTGVILFTLGFVLGYGGFPAIIRTELKKNLDILDPETEGAKNFLVPPVPLHMKFYMYSIENGEEFKAGAKPKVVEKGPFVYREDREKVDLGPNFEDPEALNVTFGQNKTWFFDQDLSCADCTKDTVIQVINAPLIGLVAVLSEIDFLGPVYLGKINDEITNPNGKYYDDLVISVTVDDFLFGGIKPGGINYVLEELYSLFGSNLPYVIQKENGFAVLNTKNGSAHNEYYRVDTGKTDMDDYLQILEYGKEMSKLEPDLNETDWWQRGGGWKENPNSANTLRGTDGQQFHPDVKKDEILWIFQTDLCRSMFLEYKDSVKVEGIQTLRFTAPPKALAANTKHNLAFCMEVETEVPWNNCAVEDPNDPDLLDLSECFNDPGYRGTCFDGTLDITRCMEKAPVVMSSPHFYQSPAELREAIDGLSPPVEEDHGTFISIEPITGMSINIQKRIQINIPVLKSDKIDYLNNVEEVLLPMLWLEEGAIIDDENKKKLRNMAITPVKATIGVQWALIVVGAVMFVVAVIVAFVKA